LRLWEMVGVSTSKIIRLYPPLNYETERSTSGKWRYVIYSDGVIFYRSAARYKNQRYAAFRGKHHCDETRKTFPIALKRLIDWNKKIARYYQIEVTE
jgi:hypothetical protein